jgi:heme A synthase
MRALRKLIATGAVVGALTTGAWVATSASASAETVCNQWHECWHVNNHYNDYPAGVGIVFHPDNWHGRHYHWRHDNSGHGYYRNGVWIGF